MNLIISSFTLNQNFLNIFNNKNIKYKFLLYNDLLKKINKKYLQSSKIIFFYEEENKENDLNILISLFKKYHKELQLFLINFHRFELNDLSLFFINEFCNSHFLLNDFTFFQNKKDSTFLPTILFNHNIQKNIIINGVCKNIVKYIYNSLYKFLYLSQYFQKSKIIIYENDSIDDTLKILNEFKNQYKNQNKNIDIIILSEKNIQGSLTQRISHARNTILNYIHNNQLNPNYLITLDMDDVLLDFHCDSILYPFKENIKWSMFGGNSEIYYDMWALRTLKEPYKDFWKDKKNNNKMIMPIEKILESYFKISQDSQPIPVFSCFNGIGIYKYKDIINCYYNGDKTCEHIEFHKNMITKNNAQLFIHPKLIVGPHKILSKPMGFYKINKLVKNNI